jgi:hypothetical protein
MVLDFLALLLQSAGGATVGGDNLTQADFDRSLAILQAGLSVHLAGIVIFASFVSRCYPYFGKFESHSPSSIDLSYARSLQKRKIMSLRESPIVIPKPSYFLSLYTSLNTPLDSSS